jgi:hypothetical protein
LSGLRVRIPGHGVDFEPDRSIKPIDSAMLRNGGRTSSSRRRRGGRQEAAER